MTWSLGCRQIRVNSTSRERGEEREFHCHREDYKIVSTTYLESSSRPSSFLPEVRSEQLRTGLHG